MRFDPSRALSLRRLVRGTDPDIVQAHGGEALKYAVAANVGLSSRIVYRRIGSAPAWLLHGPRRSLYAFLMRRAARVVAVADAVRDETIRLFGLPSGHVVTIPNAVSPMRVESCRDRDEIRQMLGIPFQGKVILSIGAITWEKDPLSHVAVATRIMRRLPEAYHVMVGDGPMRAEVERAVRQEGFASRVKLLGNRRDMGDLLKAADLLLFASRSHGMEGMPAVVIEAGMAGVPVVGYRVAGVSEVVSDGETGILVGVGDRDALSESALRLLNDVDEGRLLGAAARIRCRERFSINTVSSEYLELYQDVASGT